MQRRVILITLDGVGIGALPDAERYGDAGAHTLRHVAQAYGGLSLPNLQRLGLGNIDPLPGVEPTPSPQACYGKMAEVSCGKDTTTGHWELAGLRIREPFACYPQGFPEEIIEAFTARTGLQPLGNCAASGTEIIRQLGEEHCRTGRPIVYTSSDSVFQIAAHEEVVPVDELYRICLIAREILDDYQVVRVIARPFVGHDSGSFVRTSRRHDYSIPPCGKTVLDQLSSAGLQVHGVGKIHDIFAGVGLTSWESSRSDEDGCDKLLNALETVSRGLVFVNLVDFDMRFGHRLDALGFAENLQAFDGRVPELLSALGAGDLLIITADHGCDPTTPGTDHSREYVPLLVWEPGMPAGSALGERQCFSDVAATIAGWFGLENDWGESFLKVEPG